MTTLAFVMLIATIFISLLGLESAPADGRRLPRQAGLWAWLTTGNWSAKLGAGLIVLGIGALLRYLLLHIELPNGLKLGSGVVLSVLLALAALGLRAQPKRRGLRLALAGAAGGVAYLTAYSAYALFHYAIQQSTTFSLLLVVTVLVGVIAVRERAQSMAVLAMLGGFMAPYFALNKAGPLELNGYYLLLSLLVLAMVAMRGWRALIHLSFLFTLAATLFFGWSNNYYQPAYYSVMLPMLLALTGVHLAMPLLEELHGSQHVGWLRRADQGYAWALPLTALALAFTLADGLQLTALAIALLAGVWLLAAALAYGMRQSSARHVWVAGLMLLLAGGVYLRDTNLPWPLLGVLLACVLYAMAPRLSLQAALQDWLGLTILLLAVAHIAESAFSLRHPGVTRAHTENLVLSCLLLGTAWVGRKRGNRFVEIMGWAGGLWGALAFVNLLINLNLTHWSSILFVVGLVASGALFMLRRWILHPLAPAAMAVWLLAVGASAAAETTMPWTAMAAFGLLAALVLLVQTALRLPEEDRGAAVASIVLVLLPLALWPWGRMVGVSLDWQGSAFGLSVLMLGVFVSATIAQYQLPDDSRWHQNLAPMMLYVVAAVLALRLIGWVECTTWGVAFEVLALGYLALRLHWMTRGAVEWDKALMRRYALIGVLLAALFLQAQALRLWGPSGKVLTVMDLHNLSAPVLLSLLWAVLGASLAIGGHRLKERLIWSSGAALLVLAAGKIVLLDSGSLGSLANILSVIASGGLFLVVSWWAPFPPESSSASQQKKATTQAAKSAATPPVSADTGKPIVMQTAAFKEPKWHDTVPMEPENAEAIAADSQVKHVPAPLQTKIESPSSQVWGWLLVGGSLLFIWVGYRDVQERQRQRERVERLAQEIARGERDSSAAEAAKQQAIQAIQAIQASRIARQERQERQKTLENLPEDINPPRVQISAVAKGSAESRTSECRFSTLEAPNDMLVYAAGGYEGRKLNFQIDQSGHEATQFDITVNSPFRPIALMLGSYEPTVWNIGWTVGTKIAAVLVSGYHRQAVVGLPASIPVLNSSYDNRGACGYFYIERQHNLKLNPIAQQLFGKPVDRIFFEERSGSIVAGAPLGNGNRLESSATVSPMSFRVTTNPSLSGETDSRKP